MALKLGVIVFAGAHRAKEVLDGFQTVHADEEWAQHVGIIERRKHGKIATYGVTREDYLWEKEGSEPVIGLSTGGLTGVLIGSLAGPPGMAVGGAFGGILGGLLGAADDSEYASFYDIVRAKLERDSSALVLLADGEHVDELIAATRGGARDVHEQDVREERRGNMEEALRDAARQSARVQH